MTRFRPTDVRSTWDVPVGLPAISSNAVGKRKGLERLPGSIFFVQLVLGIAN